jgi:hypothetical protein
MWMNGILVARNREKRRTKGDKDRDQKTRSGHGKSIYKEAKRSEGGKGVKRERKREMRTKGKKEGGWLSKLPLKTPSRARSENRG